MNPAKPFVKFGVSERDGKLVGDDSDAHLMTIAPTGAGKGTTSIIPNALTWPGSLFCIDPKGEIIERTIMQRRKHNTNVYLLDPMFIVKDLPGCKRARFNPMDFIDVTYAGITLADRLADALIMKEKGDNVYFTNEARALLKALILHVRTDPLYHGARNLRTVNEIASDPLRLIGEDDHTGELQANMAFDGLIARLGRRIAQKGDREGPAVWSTLQSNLAQFLDDPRIASSVSGTDFDFASLTKDRISVFAVLPPQFLETFNRWLRLLVGSALDRLYENIGEKNRAPLPALMVLDEFAHLGNLEAIKTAYGLARGAGVKIWAILQSLSQLDDVYGEHVRENFIANSGAIEIFNMNDNIGCKYFSEKIGDDYVHVQSVSNSVSTSTKGAPLRGQAGEDPNSVGQSIDVKEERRPRMLPLHIANLDRNRKILFRRGHDFEILHKVDYRFHPELRELAG